MHIEIRIERPLALLVITGGVVWGLLSLMQQGTVAAAVGGTSKDEQVLTAEAQIRTLREEQEVLEHRESILRTQLSALQEEADSRGMADPFTQQDIQSVTASLVRLFQDRQATEQALLQSMRQMWDAQGKASLASTQSNGVSPSALAWPVEPALGVSAHFHDAGYKKRFGMEHEAVDIPVNQGTTITAPADGIIRLVSDNGLGYSSLVIDHGGGLATLYGHVSKFLVAEGQTVSAGEAVALSGGRPGSAGAGMFTTGPHLHFEVHKNGVPVDPLDYLPGID